MTLCYRCDESFTPKNEWKLSEFLCPDCLESFKKAMEKGFKIYEKSRGSDFCKGVNEGNLDEVVAKLTDAMSVGFKEWDKEVLRKWVKRKFLK